LFTPEEEAFNTIAQDQRRRILKAYVLLFPMWYFIATPLSSLSGEYSEYIVGLCFVIFMGYVAFLNKKIQAILCVSCGKRFFGMYPMASYFRNSCRSCSYCMTHSSETNKS
jgi:hypothetical protein